MISQNDSGSISPNTIRIMDRELIRLIIILGISHIAIALFVIGILKLYPLATTFVMAGSLLFHIAYGLIPQIHQGPTAAEYIGDYFSGREDEDGSIEANQKGIDGLGTAPRQIREIKPTQLTSTHKADPQLESIRKEHPKI